MITVEEKNSLKLANELLPLTVLSGWKIFIAILDEHINMELAKVLAPAQSMDDLVSKEASKGAIVGIRLARGIVGSIIADADSIKAKYANADVDTTGED